MKATSHFIGVTLDPKLLADLFADLYQYLKDNDIRHSFEFYNPLSTHITLYYFDKDFTKIDRISIEKDILQVRDLFPDINVTLNQVEFFHVEAREILCYLSPSIPNILNEINALFAQNYSNDVEDNLQDFSPHASIFKIKNHQIFLEHKDNIMTIIKRYLLMVKGKNVYKSINLYSVNSKFKPEIQIIDF